jgi:hypothetical protein
MDWMDRPEGLAPPSPSGQASGGASAGESSPPTRPAATEPLPERIPRFRVRKTAQRLLDELRSTRAALDRLGGLEYLDVQAAIEQQRRLLADLEAERARLEAQLDEIRRRIVVTEETELLQEVGIYEYRHPLSDAIAYQARLKQLRDQMRTMARADGSAVLVDTNWTVNNSVAQGRKMVRETGRLMLRAYNAEADTLVRSLKPYKLESALARLGKTRETIERLGRTLGIRINPAYHMLRIAELELTADYLAKKAEEKERERAERERLREERKVQQEMARERQRLEKEQAHYQNALEALLARGASGEGGRGRRRAPARAARRDRARHRGRGRPRSERSRRLRLRHLERRRLR